MKRILKDLWFYIRDFLIKTPISILYAVITVLTLCLGFIVIEIILLGLGYTKYSPQLGKNPILTNEEINDPFFYFFYLTVYFVGLSVCIGILFLLKKLKKKVGYDYDTEENKLNSSK